MSPATPPTDLRPDGAGVVAGSRPPVGNPLRSRRAGPVVWAAVGWLAALAVAAVLADLLPLADPTDTQAGSRLVGPGRDHPLGTDQIGRDVLARTVHGARISIVVGVGAIALSTSVGATLGVLAGYYRGTTERVVMFVVDIVLAFPALLLAVALVAFSDTRGLATVTIAIAAIYLGATVRIVRTLTVSIVQHDFVLAARALGADDLRIIVREVLPNAVPTMYSLASVAVGSAIVAEGALAYLNLSVAPPTPTWGRMMASGLGHLDESLYPALVPAAAMFLTVLSLAVLGDHLHDGDARPTRR